MFEEYDCMGGTGARVVVGQGVVDDPMDVTTDLEIITCLISEIGGRVEVLRIRTRPKPPIF